MTTAKQTIDAVEKFEEQPLVDEAWSCDRGYVIVVLDRGREDHGSVFQLIDLAGHLDMNGRVEIVDDWMVKGRERDTIHFEHVDRVEERI